MVELGGNGPHSQSFDNSVFIIPAIVIVGIVVYALVKLREQALERQEKLRSSHQLIVGCEDGQIIVLDPGFKDNNNHVLVTLQTEYPVLQLAFGDFLTDLKDILATSAWNMCLIGTEQGMQDILVQSIDCKLSLFHGDQRVFEQLPLRALHPGPIGYCSTTQTLFVANNGFLAAIKLSLVSSGKQKRVNFDWSFNLGDTAIEMEVTEGLRPLTIILCRRHVSAFNQNGEVVWQIRLEAVGMSMCLYKSLQINNTQFNRLIIATTDDTLLVFRDNKLVWNCNAQMSPVSLRVCSYNKAYENTITLLSADGRIVVGYLGTEPSLYKVPVDKFIVNYAERIEQFKALEQKIRESDEGGAGGRSDGIRMRISVGEIGKRTIEPNAANNAPFCMVNVELSELQSVQKLQLNVLSECACPSKQIVLNSPSSQSSTTIQIPFYVGNKKPPTSNRVTISAHCYASQMYCIASVDLPFKILFEETQVDRNARFKVTIDTAGAVLPLNKLFTEYGSENPQAIGFTLHGTDKTVSIFAANKSNRYRIQSEHMSLLQVAAQELVQRIKKEADGMEIGGNIPFEYIRDTLESIQELEAKRKEDSKKMDKLAKEVRAIEALSLNSCKTGNMTNLASLDALFDKSYRELLDVMDDYNTVSAHIDTEKSALNSLFQLAQDLSKLQKVDTILNGYFWTNTQQSLRDRLCWAVRVERGNEMALIEKLCEHSQKELPKIKEEEEGEGSAETKE
ncbi:unnamed protein product [Caenorhabditis sp. 36 PRJEB53466]|nr:unnamed protein product [Caenorhabditis sp. 36 PRJEB53466]